MNTVKYGSAIGEQKIEGEETLLESIDRLQKALDATKATYTIPALQVNDLAENAKKFLTKDAAEVMDNKIKSLTTLDSECIFLGVQVRADKIEDGVQAISDDINLLVSEGLVTGALAGVSSINLARIPRQSPSAVVIAYVHVKKDYVDRAKNLVMYGIPEDADTEKTKKLGDLSLDLADGEFVVVLSYSHSLGMLREFSVEQELHDDISELLAILPKGTSLTKVERCAVMGLSIDFEVHFKNPLLQKVKEVKLIYLRTAAPSGDALIQGNVLVGVEYLGKDGKKVFNV